MNANTMRLGAILALLTTAAAVAAALLAVSMTTPQDARATVPPRNCGVISVSERRYQIKADQIRCRKAKSYSRTYLSSGRRPSGYRCRTFTASTKLKFRCWRSVRVFFAIRR